MHPDWLDYIDVKRRRNLLQIFEELSRLQNRDPLNFIIIGALPLLFQGYLKYRVYWDIDILFRDQQELENFIALPKSESLKIVDYDEVLMVNKNISSFHTAWAYDHIWFNVDYILRQGFFSFYANPLIAHKPYTADIAINGEKFSICIQLAHTWDIIVGKVFSPRTQRDIALRVDTSVDLRHIYAVYSCEKDNFEFWHYLFKKAEMLYDSRSFKNIFLQILDKRHELGYGSLEISPESLDLLRT